MKLKDLAKYFHLPIDDAAKEMKLCASAIKGICRKEGMERWPYRKVQIFLFQENQAKQWYMCYIEVVFASRSDKEPQERDSEGVEQHQLGWWGREIAPRGGEAAPRRRACRLLSREVVGVVIVGIAQMVIYV